MFKGKVEVYQNVNGREKTLTKNFDNYEDYATFLDTNRGLFSDFSHGLNNTFSFGLRDFENMLDRYFDSRFTLSPGNEDTTHKNFPIDLSYYEQEARKLEEEQRQKEIKKINLEKAKEMIEGYLEKFKSHGDKEKVNPLIEKANADLKKIEEELSNLK